MAKKAGTQIIESLTAAKSTADENGNCSIPLTEVDRLLKLAKRVDKRDEQNRKERKR